MIISKLNVNSIKSIILNTQTHSLKVFFRKIYLWLIGLYICVVFNEFIKRPVDFFALLLILFGLLLISSKNIALLLLAIKKSISLKILLLSLFVLSSIFIFSTVTQPFNLDSFIQFSAQYSIHIGLGLIALLVIPLNLESLDFLHNSCVLSLMLLTLSDAGYYLFQILSNLDVSIGFSHRWFGDGYVFLTPFLVARIMSLRRAIFSNSSENKTDFSVNNFHSPSKDKVLLLCFGLLTVIVVIFSGGTGSRSTYITIFLELIVCLFFLQNIKISRVSLKKRIFKNGSEFIFLIYRFFFTFALGTVFALGIIYLMSMISPYLFSSAIDRGLRATSRIENAWIPGIELITASPWFGYGFGHQIWDNAYSTLQSKHPGIINLGSPHSWFIAAGFFGGVSAIVAQLIFVICLIFLLLRVTFKSYAKLIFRKTEFFLNSEPSLSGKKEVSEIFHTSLASVLSFIAFYCLRGAVEYTIYKYISVTLILGVLVILIWGDRRFKKLHLA